MTKNTKPLSAGDSLVAIRSYYGVGAATPEIFPVTVASVGKRDIKVTRDGTDLTYVFRVDDAQREARNVTTGRVVFHDPDSETVANVRTRIARDNAKNELRRQIETVERHLRGYDEVFDAESLHSAIDAYAATLDEEG